MQGGKGIGNDKRLRPATRFHPTMWSRTRKVSECEFRAGLRVTADSRLEQRRSPPHSPGHFEAALVRSEDALRDADTWR
jgi:hypothetical protein